MKNIELIINGFVNLCPNVSITVISVLKCNFLKLRVVYSCSAISITIAIVKEIKRT